VELKENKININGLTINYVEAGVGQPMIFLHNGGGFWHTWEHQIKHFAKRYKVYGIDWPGFGESEHPDGLITLDLLTETLSGFITNKQLEDVVLIGNCIGGSAALLYNMNNPNSVDKLIIFNICPGDLIFRLPPMRRYISYLNRRKKSKSIIRSILIFGFTKTPIKRRFPKILFGNNFDKDCSLSQRYIEKFKLETQTASRVNLVFSVHTFNLLRYYDKTKIPAHLLVWGKYNSVTSLKNHGHYHRKLLNPSQFEVIDNAGHLCMYEQPEITITLLENYLNSTQ
jgi:pimeloyl-ACP methyl ester carboxylesterase